MFYVLTIPHERGKLRMIDSSSDRKIGVTFIRQKAPTCDKVMIGLQVWEW